MTRNASNFTPGSSLKALLDQLQDIKFSKHTTLVVVLLGMIYTIYRTQDYLASQFHLSAVVSFPTSVFIELLVLASGAFVFGSLRGAYVAELKGEDTALAKPGVYLSGFALAVSFLALLFIAWADAYQMTKQIIPSLIMTLVQITQMLFVVGFIIAANLDERERLRAGFADFQVGQQRAKEEEAQRKARQCPHCFIEVAPNNRKRHIESCPARSQA